MMETTTTTTIAPMTPNGCNIIIHCDRGPSIPLWYVYVAEYPGSRYYDKSMPFMTEEAAKAEVERLMNGGQR